jgi:hypothetical protein
MMKYLFSGITGISVVSIVLCLQACNISYSNKAKSWNPYKELNMLIFESDNKKRDSIFIGEIKEVQQGSNQVTTVNAEIVKRDSLHSKNRITTLMTITSWESGDGTVTINLNTDNARLWPFTTQRTTWLDSIPKTTTTVSDVEYRDVITLEPDSTHPDYASFASNKTFVTEILWSKSNGLIQYKLKDGSTWKLVKKYSI